MHNILCPSIYIAGKVWYYGKGLFNLTIRFKIYNTALGEKEGGQ